MAMSRGSSTDRAAKEKTRMQVLMLFIHDKQIIGLQNEPVTSSKTITAPDSFEI